MSIFGKIMSAIMGTAAHAEAPATPGSSPIGGSAATPSATAPAGQPVDVEAVLSGLAAKSAEPLEWRRSIVDLMKLLGLDSSLAARKELAQELHYPGDTGDSAAMNTWLHAQVMAKLAANGGKVPADLKD